MAGARAVGSLWEIKLRSGWTPVFSGGYYRNSGEHLLVFGSCDDRLSTRCGLLLAGRASIDGRTHKAQRLDSAQSSVDVWPYSDDIFPERQATDNILGKAVKVERNDGLFMGIILGQLDGHWTIGFLDGSHESGRFRSEYAEFLLANGTSVGLDWLDLDASQLAPLPEGSEDEQALESPVQEHDEEFSDQVERAGSGETEEVTTGQRCDGIEVIDLIESDDSDAQSGMVDQGGKSAVCEGGEALGVQEFIVINCDERPAAPCKKRPREQPVSAPKVLSKVAKVGIGKAKKTGFQYSDEDLNPQYEDTRTPGAHLPQERARPELACAMDIDVAPERHDHAGLQLQSPDSPKQVTPLFAKFFKDREVVEPARETSVGEADLDESATTMGNCKVTVVNGAGHGEHATSGDDKAPMVTDNGFAAALHLRCFESSLDVPGRSLAKIKKATSYAISGAEFGVAGKVVQLIVGKMESAGDVEKKIDMLYLLESILHSSNKADPAKNDYRTWVELELSRIIRAMTTDCLGAAKLTKILKLWEVRGSLCGEVLRMARDLMMSLEPCAGSRLTSR